MLIIRRRTFSNFYKHARVMTINRYIIDEYDKITDYREIKNTFKINSRNTGIMHDNKFLNDEITDYKIEKRCSRPELWRNEYHHLGTEEKQLK